jgi:hypothetical protein
VDYSLFIMVMIVEMLQKVEIPLVEFPPPIFAGSRSVLVFRCFYGTLLEEASGSPLYMGF